MVTLSRPVREKIRALAEQNKYDVYLNLCDGASDEEYPGVDVVEALEEFNMAFTGANSKVYDPTRMELALPKVIAWTRKRMRLTFARICVTRS